MNPDKTQWHLAVPGKLAHSNEVHVWRAFLDLPVFQIQKMLADLSADEVARTRRFRFQRDQHRFIVARSVLRQILGHYLENKPNKFRFDYNANGKPTLADDPCYHTISFNLSHCGSIALYAFTRCSDVGIDIERVRHDISIEEIAHRFFAPGEINALKAIHENKRHEAFFQYWTRKEAVLKAKGEGLSFPIEQVDVSSMNAKVLSPAILPGNESRRWYVRDLFLDHDYVGAIAVEGNDRGLSYWQYAAAQHNGC